MQLTFDNNLDGILAWYTVCSLTHKDKDFLTSEYQNVKKLAVTYLFVSLQWKNCIEYKKVYIVCILFLLVLKVSQLRTLFISIISSVSNIFSSLIRDIWGTVLSFPGFETREWIKKRVNVTRAQKCIKSNWGIQNVFASIKQVWHLKSNKKSFWYLISCTGDLVT